jgi:hypothetical protein
MRGETVEQACPAAKPPTVSKKPRILLQGCGVLIVGLTTKEDYPFPIIPRIAAGRSAGSITSLAFGDRAIFCRVLM